MMTQLFPAPMDQEGYQLLHGLCSEQTRLQVVTGNLVKLVNLVNVPTVGPPLQFGLTYNAQDPNTTLGPVGVSKWRHNHMMKLLFSGSPTHLVTFIEETGRHYDLELVSGSWVFKSSTSKFDFDMQLSQSGSDWRVTFFPSLTFYQFDSSGVLTRIEDRHGKALTYTYSSGKLSTISEPTGRSITFTYNPAAPYSGNYLTGVTDPRGKTFQLAYDTASWKLTGVVFPEGCSLAYDYGTGGKQYYITKTTQTLGTFYEYAYDNMDTVNDIYRVATVKDSEATQNVLSYNYDRSEREMLGDEAGTGDPDGDSLLSFGLYQTKMTDARGKVWTYRFDKSQDPWRIMDPLDHWTKIYHDPNQREIYRSDPYPYRSGGSVTFPGPFPGPWESPRNRAFRKITDVYGNVLYDVDPMGVATKLEYDYANNRRLTSVYPGQAHYGVQGSFSGEFGADGYVLCAFNENGTDVIKLPSYLDASTPIVDDATHPPTRPTPMKDGLDHSNPRLVTTPTGPYTSTRPSGLQRKLNQWRSVTTWNELKFQVKIDTTLSGTTRFNLSVYTHSADDDSAKFVNFPQLAQGQYGRDLEIVVQDLVGTQTYRVYNNAAGVWVTFPVEANSANPYITVSVAPTGENLAGIAVISALAFDPYASRRTSFSYTASSDVNEVTDRLGNAVEMTYNADGQLATYVDELDRTTSYFYEDNSKNLTRIVAPDNGSVRMEYDLNGNLLRMTDGENRDIFYEYDDQNRLVSTTDGLGHRSTTVFNENGMVEQTVDALGRVTHYVYTVGQNSSPTNRLGKIEDPLNGSADPTVFTYYPDGRVHTVTDPEGQTTTYVRDDAGRIEEIELPDEEKVSYGLDGMGRVVAVNPPNANQDSLTAINTVGSMSPVQNPSFAEADPYDASRPRAWRKFLDLYPDYDLTNGYRIRDGSSQPPCIGRDPNGSNSNGVWVQYPLDVHPGVQNILRAAAWKEQATGSATVSLQCMCLDVEWKWQLAGAASHGFTPGNNGWEVMDWARFQIASDSQYSDFPARLVVHCQDHTYSSSGKLLLDDVELYPLGIAYRYNKNSQLTSIRTPDGAEVFPLTLQGRRTQLLTQDL